MKINTRAITLTAVLAALCAVTGMIPYVFFIPVTVAATTLSLGTVAAVGLSFGLISMIYSFVMPMSLVSMAFVQAPYIAIFPRILAAVCAHLAFRLMIKLTGDKKRSHIIASSAVSAAVGSLVNTASVVGLLVLIMPDLELGGITMYMYVPTMLISGAIECACMAVLTPPVTLALRKNVLSRRGKKLQPATAATVSGEASNSGNPSSANCSNIGSDSAISDDPGDSKSSDKNNSDG